MTSILKRIWSNEYIKTGIMIAVIIAVVFGFWAGSQIVLNTQYPVLAVASGSMCRVDYMYCDGWSHPFDETLHFGDLIVVQGVDASQIKTAFYPEGEIIVFHRPKSSADAPDELIVHRAVDNATRDGLIYFRTKGDGSSGTFTDNWSLDYRGQNYSWNGMISEKMLVGKVVMRIPWIGHIALLMHNSSAGFFIIAVLIVVLILVEFVFPLFGGKEDEAVPKEALEEHADGA
jgi:hypothetical protein